VGRKRPLREQPKKAPAPDAGSERACELIPRRKKGVGSSPRQRAENRVPSPEKEVTGRTGYAYRGKGEKRIMESPLDQGS